MALRDFFISVPLSVLGSGAQGGLGEGLAKLPGGAGTGIALGNPSRAALDAEPRSRMDTRGLWGCQGSAHSDRLSGLAFADPSFNCPDSESCRVWR